jgi:hypothetical protein
MPQYGRWIFNEVGMTKESLERSKRVCWFGNSDIINPVKADPENEIKQTLTKEEFEKEVRDQGLEREFGMVDEIDIDNY